LCCFRCCANTFRRCFRLRRWFPFEGCVFRGKSARHSDVMSAGDSDAMSATDSNLMSATP
jgi:hypothetical protein